MKTINARMDTGRSWVYSAVEFCIFLEFVAIMYKQQPLMLLAGLLLSVLAFFIPVTFTLRFTPLFFLTIFYLAMCTLTTWMVDGGEAVTKTVQFAILVGMSWSIGIYISTASAQRLYLFFRRFTAVVAFVFVHMVLYHVANGYFTTWKYLYEAKTTISLAVVIYFAWEDIIKRGKGPVWWIAGLVTLSVLVVLSGERKALVTLIVIYIISRASAATKLAIGIAALFILQTLVLTAEPGSYIARQIMSIISPAPELSQSELYSVENIGDQSDLVRQFVNTNARELFYDNPIFGLGATGYQAWAVERYGSISENGGLSMNVHGELNRVPVENGVVGIAIAISFFALVFIRALRGTLRIENKGSASLRRLPLYAFVFLAFFAGFEATDFSMLLIIGVFGMSMALGEVKERERQRIAWHSREFGRRAATRATL